MQRVWRELDNVVALGPLYHEALMLITGNAPLETKFQLIRETPDNQLMIQYHICEWMDDSKAHFKLKERKIQLSKQMMNQKLTLMMENIYGIAQPNIIFYLVRKQKLQKSKRNDAECCQQEGPLQQATQQLQTGCKKKQKPKSISKNRVILVQRVQRKIATVQTLFDLYHDALMLITGKAPLVSSYENIREIRDEKLGIKYQICECLDDSIDRAYGILSNKIQLLKQMMRFTHSLMMENNLWIRPAYDLFLYKWEINVEAVKEMMQKFVDKKNSIFDFFTDNRRKAAENTIAWMYQEEAIARGQIDCLQKQKFP